MKFIKIIFVLAILSSIPGTKVYAHPADMYANTIRITFTETNLQINWEIKPGPLLSGFIWYQIDIDRDGSLSDSEIESWSASQADLLTATLDDQPLPLLIESVKIPSSLQSFQSGEEFITLTLASQLPQSSSNQQRLKLENKFETKTSINWFYLIATGEIAFLLPTQESQIINVDIVKNKGLIADQSTLLFEWDSGTPSLPFNKDVVTETAEQMVPELQERTPQEILLELVRTQELSISFYLFAVGISLALGALHALTPGHGKTVVAAYLVGSRGTAKHAITLGSVVTVTHTGSVFLLGIVTLAASQYILPTSLIPWLEVISGLTIVGLGFYLLWQRFLYWQNSKAEQSFKIKNQSVRKVALTPASKPRKIAGNINIQKPLPTMHHHGDGKMHSHDIPETITWRSLITLGISGGLVPCPDAIAILLVAIAINRILLGLVLIVSFSIGLAVVLIVIGLLMVNGSRLFTRLDSFNKFAPALPVVSASIVLILGIGLTYGAIKKIRESSSYQLAVQGSIEEAGIVYINQDQNDQKQLFMADTQGSQPHQLTNSSYGIIDYSISPDQTQVIYVEANDELEYAFWLINLADKQSRVIASCKEAECGQPIWSPDGQHVVYEYMDVSADGTTTGTSSIWWLDVNSGETKSVFQDESLPGTNPRWSPKGDWLSYATPEGVHLYDIANGESRLIKNILSPAALWSPDGESILLRDVIIKDNQFVTQLFLYNIEMESLTRLNPNENMENILAAWSPEGETIAVVRRDLSIPHGNQIWLMNADGSNARAITDVPDVLFGNLSWSPDGEYLLYDLYPLGNFPIESRLEMIHVKTGEITNLQLEGYNPSWI